MHIRWFGPSNFFSGLVPLEIKDGLVTIRLLYELSLCNLEFACIKDCLVPFEIKDGLVPFGIKDGFVLFKIRDGLVPFGIKYGLVPFEIKEG